MSEGPFTLIWEPVATNAAAGFLRHDPAGVRSLIDVIDTLAIDPEPAASAPFGLGRRRMRAGRYRVVYEVDSGARQIRLVHLGRART